MENKILAIKGHSTRGKEVIEILEMLGGKNDNHCYGAFINRIYFINENLYIECCCKMHHLDYLQLSLEEFLEKYPYKVGDKVQCKSLESGSIYSCCSIFVVEKMLWENNQIKYIICNTCCDTHKFTTTAEYLQPFKEEIKAEDRLEIYTDTAIVDDSKTDIIINGEKLIAPNGYTIGNITTNGDSLIMEYIKNKPQYPKTYKECCDVLGINPKANDAQGYKADDIICFQELLIYRDAYWKIAGEEMGLSEPWKPDCNEAICAIGTYYGTIEKRMVVGGGILLFPTKEMRDAFYENFMDLIEKCKEFL